MPPSYALDLDPATTNLFWQHNRIHDEYYDYGFTESAGNFQLNNPTRAATAATRSWASCTPARPAAARRPTPAATTPTSSTLPDGIPPWSGMFLWEPINDAFEGPCADGNFDARVIQHEYTHGLSKRYVGGGEALGTHQSGSMGEGWGDWYALNYLHRRGPTRRRSSAST